MRNRIPGNMLVAFIVTVVVLAPLGGMANEVVDMEGEVGENYQLVDLGGQVYEIADTTQGNQLAEKHVGERVKVTGTIEIGKGNRLIVVTSFHTLEQ